MMEKQTVLDFWFLPPGAPGFGQQRNEWFQATEEFDQACRDVLGPYFDAALDGALDDWQDHPEGALALCILLDQVPRNLYRGTSRAFCADAKALTIAKVAVDQGFDHQLMPVQRVFLYLPFEHSESIRDQDRSVELFELLRGTLPDAFLDYAEKHRKVVARFGRFPHRNKALGRTNTPEEAAFLAEPGSSFW